MDNLNTINIRDESEDREISTMCRNLIIQNLRHIKMRIQLINDSFSFITLIRLKFKKTVSS